MYVQAEARGKPRGVWERHSPHDVTVEERPWETGKSAPGSRGSHRQGSAQVPGRAPCVWEGLAKHHGAPLPALPRLLAGRPAAPTVLRWGFLKGQRCGEG